MKAILITLTSIVAFALLQPSKANAFNVDKMVIMSDTKGNGVITVENDESNAIFVRANVQEINVVDGHEVVRNDYTRENLEDWKISLTHPKFVLKPGEEKAIGIRSLCHEVSCDTSKDLMFMLPFMPTHYDPDGNKKSGVEVNYGFSALYIIPTRKPQINYEIINKGDELQITNDSNTLLYAVVDTCIATQDEKCKLKFTVLSGRKKSFSLPSSMQAERLAVTISSHDRSYLKEENTTQI